MGSCDNHCEINERATSSRGYRKILWLCLMANAVMFIVQMAASYMAGSVSLLANSADFLSDAANYGISLWVLTKTLHIKAKASILKGVSIGIVGLWVAYETFLHSLEQTIPQPDIMVMTSILALMVNIGCAVLLYRYRKGDSNARSVWLCSRNDAIGNIAVMVAAAGVFTLNSVWPDIIVATILAWLALSTSWQILSDAVIEIKLVKTHLKKIDIKNDNHY